jgi:hypothetical protein
MNRFIGNDGSIDAKIAKAIEDTYRLTASTSRAYYGKGILWESTFSATGVKIITPFEKGPEDNVLRMSCGGSRWGGSHVIG